jgi:hypothetical protein
MIRSKRETKIAKNPRSNPPFLANPMTLAGSIGPVGSAAYPFFTDD